MRGRRRTSLAVAVLGVGLPLAAFAPHALQAWQKDVSAWDRALSERIHSYENQSTLLNRHVDVLGLPLHWSIQAVGLFLLVGAAVANARGGRRRTGAFLALCAAGAIVLPPVLKEIFAAPPVDPRPGSDGSTFEVLGTGFAFPSGHALRSMIFVGALVAVVDGRLWRRIALLVGGALVIAIGVGVVYHEWHWTSDVLGGWFVAIAWVSIGWLVLRPDRDRRTVCQPR